MRLLLSLLLVSQSGCVYAGYALVRGIQSSAFNSKLQAYVGKDVGAMVSDFGPPTASVKNGDKSVVAWAIGTGKAVLVNGNAGVITSGACNVWVDVDEASIVKRWHWRGDC